MSRPPAGLSTRGRRVWTKMAADASWSEAELVLLEEGCRLADRMDRLDAVLRGDVESWVRLRVDESGVDVTVTVDSVLSEARQHATAYKQILAELRQARKSTPAAGTRPAGKGRARAGVADLSAKIAERRAQAQG